MPGLKSENIGSGDYSWLLNTHAANAGGQGVVDISAFTKATHYPDGYLPSGLPVNAADRTKLVPWADAAGAVLAFIDGDHATDGVEDINAALITHADGIIVKNVPLSTFAKPSTAAQPQFGQYL